MSHIEGPAGPAAKEGPSVVEVVIFTYVKFNNEGNSYSQLAHPGQLPERCLERILLPKLQGTYYFRREISLCLL